MNTQAQDIDKAIARLEALKAKTRRPACSTRQAQLDSYEYEKDIMLQVADIVADLMSDLCLGVASLGDDNSEGTFREYFYEAVVETSYQCLSKAESIVEEVIEELGLERAA